MEWRKAALVAMVGMLLMAAIAESARAGVDADADADEVIQLVSDGVDEYKGKNMENVGCPRILMPCKVDSDCFPTCKCLSNGYCG